MSLKTNELLHIRMKHKSPLNLQSIFFAGITQIQIENRKGKSLNNYIP